MTLGWMGTTAAVSVLAAMPKGAFAAEPSLDLSLTAGGLVSYFRVVPPQFVRGRLAEHFERRLHGAPNDWQACRAGAASGWAPMATRPARPVQEGGRSTAARASSGVGAKRDELMSVLRWSSLRVDCWSARWIVAAVCMGILAPTSVAYATGEAPGGYRNVDGYAIYLGVVPAAIAQGHPPDHPERKMHGGAPWGRGQHHVMVAVFDAASGARIDDAVVTAKVGEPGLTPVQRPLEPMLIAAAWSYGNYFALSPPGPYWIELHIVWPDAGRPIVTTFTYALR